MKVLLMHQDRDFDPRREEPWNVATLMQDLELNTLLSAIAGQDRFLFDVARSALFSGLSNDVETILYRQEILKDCLRNPSVVRELYDLAVETLTAKQRSWLGIFSRSPSGILSESIDLMQMFLQRLRRLRGIAEAHAGLFKSKGFTSIFDMIIRELSDNYLNGVQAHLTELKFGKGILLSAGLGDSNTGVNYVLRQWVGKGSSWLRRLFVRGTADYTFHLDEKDDAGARILSQMQSRGINLVANALAQSADHVLSFFKVLRTELAFYVGCLNLYDRLKSKGEPVCFPSPSRAGTRGLRFSGLYDACLSLHLDGRVVGNTVDADAKNIVIVTGANQGGKSVFLRSIGLAQIMMQCGMYVTAESFEAELCGGLFTHYKREEDAAMTMGKLDEELARMSDIADHLVPNAMLLCNESFAATNQREGSEIARQIVYALLDKHIKVLFVTHLYDFAHGFLHMKAEDALFLRAERLPDGRRTFRLIEGEPLETSFGEDLYSEIFENVTQSPAAGKPAG